MKYLRPKSKLIIGVGREVTTIVNENKLIGNYNVQFNAGKLTSGVYFYRMQAGNFVQKKKLIYLK
jgi:hypothetical protein